MSIEIHHMLYAVTLMNFAKSSTIIFRHENRERSFANFWKWNEFSSRFVQFQFFSNHGTINNISWYPNGKIPFQRHSNITIMKMTYHYELQQ